MSSFTCVLQETKLEHIIRVQKLANDLTEVALAALPGEDTSNTDIERKTRVHYSGWERDWPRELPSHRSPETGMGGTN